MQSWSGPRGRGLAAELLLQKAERTHRDVTARRARRLWRAPGHGRAGAVRRHGQPRGRNRPCRQCRGPAPRHSHHQVRLFAGGRRELEESALLRKRCAVPACTGGVECMESRAAPTVNAPVFPVGVFEQRLVRVVCKVRLVLKVPTVVGIEARCGTYCWPRRSKPFLVPCSSSIP